MRQQTVKERIRHNKWKKQMRLAHGKDWRKKLRDGVILTPTMTAERLPTMTVEEMRLKFRAVNPPKIQPAYIEGVSPNA
jgi:hypothetical protein